MILTGPKQGLALLDAMHVEIDLKIKGRHGQDRELSKGVLFIKGTVHRSLKECKLETNSLSTRLNTVDVTYAVAPIVVEATVAVEVIEGNFDGRITAHTSSVRKSLVLYDSKVPGDGHRLCLGPRPTWCGSQESMVLWFNLVTAISYVVARIMDVAGCLAGFLRLAMGNPILIGSKQGNRAIQLKRPVVSVFVKDWLIIVAKTGDGKSVHRIGFSPKKKGREEAVITVGVTKMRVKVAWPIMDP